MAYSVYSAFREFNNNHVNLDSQVTDQARKSRDWLIDNLERFPDAIDDFPKLFSKRHIKYGSFARNTKITPLDDIDLILTFSAQESTYFTITPGKCYCLFVNADAKNLIKISNDDGTINSIKLVNLVRKSLKGIGNYSSADINRRQEAVTLNLTSYPWKFDIVPAFYTDTGHYLIPDGNGNWKATDPRIDQENVTGCNQQHNGIILQLIRTLKYWNVRSVMPTIPSYLFEVLIVNYFKSQLDVKDWIDFNLRAFWLHLSKAIYNSVFDPKNFQGNINNIELTDKYKISKKAIDAYKEADEAINLKLNEDSPRKSINKWRTIFGTDFPKYG